MRCVAVWPLLGMLAHHTDLLSDRRCAPLLARTHSLAPSFVCDFFSDPPACAGQMPYSTPFLPLTVSASASYPSAAYQLLTDAPKQQAQRPPPQQPHQRAASGALTSSDGAAAAQAGSTKAAAAAPAQKPTTSFSRRSTLTSRFPLLRKGSREAPGHLRGNSVSAPLPDSPFLTTGAPRASSSSSRGRIDRQSDEPLLREPSVNASLRSESRDAADSASPSANDSHEPAVSAASTPNTISDSEVAGSKLDKSRQPSVSFKAAKPHDKKMHQTSSRLLRMTDDERPFTRVSRPRFPLSHGVSIPTSIPGVYHRRKHEAGRGPASAKQPHSRYCSELAILWTAHAWVLACSILGRATMVCVSYDVLTRKRRPGWEALSRADRRRTLYEAVQDDHLRN